MKKVVEVSAEKLRQESRKVSFEISVEDKIQEPLKFRVIFSSRQCLAFVIELVLFLNFCWF